MGASLHVAGAVALELATKDEVIGASDRLAKLLERPHARFLRLSDGEEPRAGNLPFVINLGRPPGGMMWMLQYLILTGDDATAGAALQGSSAAVQTDVDNSATGAAAPIVATLPAVAGATTFITGFEVTGGGATLGSDISITVTGILGGTKTYVLSVPAGVLLGVVPLVVQFSRPIPASAPNTVIAVNVPSFGAGSTVQAVTAHGFQQVAAVAGSGGQIPNVRAAVFAGSGPTDASLAGTTSISGADFGGLLAAGLAIPSTTELPNKTVIYSNEDLYVVIGGPGALAGANFYHVTAGILELPQTPEALLW
jgi:hypothetical protein